MIDFYVMGYNDGLHNALDHALRNNPEYIRGYHDGIADAAEKTEKYVNGKLNKP